MEETTLVLRFRDLVTDNGGTILEHMELIKKNKYVWWAWWKKQHEQTPSSVFTLLKELLPDDPQEFFLVDSGQGRIYKALCTGIEFRAKSPISSPQSDCTPAYYSANNYHAWFRFSQITPCDESALRSFSYVDCKELLKEDSWNYSMFSNKRIFSVKELIQQNRSLWLVRPAATSDSDHEIVLHELDYANPKDFSTNYHQSTGDALLWLSDLHMTNTGYEKEEGKLSKTMGAHIKGCLANKKIAGIIVSGDITDKASEEGFTQAKALLNELNAVLCGSNSGKTILICPGNHDFSWETKELEKEPGSDKRKEPDFIYNHPDNAKLYSDLYHSLYKKQPNQYYSCGKKFLLSSGHLVEVAALNSVLLQQYPNFEGHGYLSEEQLNFVAEHMGWTENPNSPAIRIAVMHHHYLPVCLTEKPSADRASSSVYDADRLMKWMVQHNIKLLLHGHKHQGFVSQILYPDKATSNLSSDDLHKVTVIGLGGIGPRDTSNEFAIIRFKHDEIILECCRVYPDNSSPDGYSKTISLKL